MSSWAESPVTEPITLSTWTRQRRARSEGGETNLAGNTVLGTLCVADGLRSLVLSVARGLLLLASNRGLGRTDKVADGLADAADGGVDGSVDLRNVSSGRAERRTHFRGSSGHGWMVSKSEIASFERGEDIPRRRHPAPSSTARPSPSTATAMPVASYSSVDSIPPRHGVSPFTIDRGCQARTTLGAPSLGLYPRRQLLLERRSVSIDLVAS